MEKYAHLILPFDPNTLLYTTTNRGFTSTQPPPRDRKQHGEYLKQLFNQAWTASEEEEVQMHITRHGVYLEFESDPGTELMINSLEEKTSKQIRLVNVRKIDRGQGEITLATVYVAKDKKQFFLNKIQKYLDKETSSGAPQNKPLINSIAQLRKALLVDSFWTDDLALVPREEKQWVEVWITTYTGSSVTEFEATLASLNIQARNGTVHFPERAVKVIYADDKDLERLSASTDYLAEYRPAKECAALFLDMPVHEQADWINNLLARTEFNTETNSAVCILDTGVNRGHPLLQPMLAENDCQSVDPEWGTHDHDKHGTLMAGTVLYGDLNPLLNSTHAVTINHRLESVKILPHDGVNAPELWADITAQAVSRAGIEAPDRQRCYCMAVSSPDTRNRGRPSSWSAMIDQLSSEPGNEKLFILSAGNVTADLDTAAKSYPEHQITDAVHDPAQSWNALTVGAYTELTNLTETRFDGYRPVAYPFTLSPYTSTSLTWEPNKWPIKPELVLEGGNLAVDDSGHANNSEELSLLSTFHEPHADGYFYPFNMTSPAAAQLANMAAQVRAQYPDFWEETVRGLLVHSAEWPEALKQQFTKSESKAELKYLLSICGYGVPHLDRALASAQNSTTLIKQAVIQPFDKKERGSEYRTKDMHVYELPWPVDVLQSLPDHVNVRMRITLSYFIEPGPGEIGHKDRYRYASHGLRFDINSPGESRDDFIKRINTAAREADEGKPATDSAAAHWTIGDTRNRGSVHSDTWNGTAPELASTNLIAIVPVIGWWRQRAHLNKWDSTTRYSLVVTIETDDQTIDLYTPISVAVGVQVPITV